MASKAVDHLTDHLIKALSAAQHGQRDFKSTRLVGHTPKGLGKTDRSIATGNHNGLGLGLRCR